MNLRYAIWFDTFLYHNIIDILVIFRTFITWGCWFCLVSKLCPTLWDPMDYSLPSSSRISQARIYWSLVPFPSPGDLPDPGVEPVSPLLHWGRFFTTESLGKFYHIKYLSFNFLWLKHLRSLCNFDDYNTMLLIFTIFYIRSLEIIYYSL